MDTQDPKAYAHKKHEQPFTFKFRLVSIIKRTVSNPKPPFTSILKPPQTPTPYPHSTTLKIIKTSVF
ncbi:hypothetical protein L2E82_27281 [Cichorium intybus]|uniref:Uncharacterized protein n=1 Tax=Cichorium intybus TaxID=13427 RepID=A0ACB9CSK1_CICIN|nr:hypothetical protein L2E82_27281 [Cichorium intybus]